MTRLLVCFLLFTFAFAACSFKKDSNTNTTSQSTPTTTAPSPSQPTSKAPDLPASAGALQPGQASGSYTSKGEVVQLKYAYAGRAVRFGEESLVLLLTENPIPADAVAEEIKSTPLLEGEKIRGLEYVLDDSSMWVRFHPGQYQESSSNKLKDYKVENDTLSGFDDNDGSLSNGKYSRNVKFAATITK